MPSLFQLYQSPQAAKKTNQIDLKSVEDGDSRYAMGDTSNRPGNTLARKVIYSWIPVFLIIFVATFTMYMVTSFLFVQYSLQDCEAVESDSQSLDELLILGELEEPEFVTLQLENSRV